MPEEEKKKNLQEQVAEAIAQQQAALGAANTEYQQGAQSALDNFKTGQQAVIDETAQGYDAQRQAVSQAYENIYGENGILGQAYKEREQRLKDEEARAAQEAKADYNSAKWSGITEVAASIANLIGVGALGASHQQYNLYSQDWMKKADANAKANRERIDRIRENLAAQKERLGQGRLQGALALSQLDREKLNQIAGMKGNLNQTEYKALLDSLGMGYQNRIAQANAGAEGALKGLSVGMQERSLNMQEENMREGRAIQRAQMAQSQKQFEAQMLAKGYNPDGTVNDAAMAKVVAASNAGKSGSGSSGSGDNYEITVGGRKMVLSMSKETYKQAILRGRNEIKKDLMAEAGFNGSWEEFVEAADQKKIKGEKGKKVENPLWKYQEMITSLEAADSDEDALARIEAYVQDHKDSAENFNSSLFLLANGRTDYGAVPSGMTGGEMSSADFLKRLNGQ